MSGLNPHKLSCLLCDEYDCEDYECETGPFKQQIIAVIKENEFLWKALHVVSNDFNDSILQHKRTERKLQRALKGD